MLKRIAPAIAVALLMALPHAADAKGNRAPLPAVARTKAAQKHRDKRIEHYRQHYLQKKAEGRIGKMTARKAQVEKAIATKVKALNKALAATPAKKPVLIILEGTDLNFDALVIENSRKGLVLVDFWAPWAGPSMRQQQVLKGLARQYGGRFLLVTVNTDEQKGIASRFGVKSLPSFKLFRNGRVVEEIHGMQPEADYRGIVDRYLVPLGDKVRLAAAKAWHAGHYDKAIQLLVEGALAEPDNLEIPAMLAKLLMRLHRYDEARDVLAALPADAADTTELATLRAHLDFITAARAVGDEAALAARPRDRAGDRRADGALRRRHAARARPPTPARAPRAAPPPPAATPTGRCPVGDPPRWGARRAAARRRRRSPWPRLRGP